MASWLKSSSDALTSKAKEQIEKLIKKFKDNKDEWIAQAKRLNADSLKEVWTEPRKSLCPCCTML
jgi:hypothetical protein